MFLPHKRVVFFSDYNGAKVYHLLGLNYLFIHALYGLPSIVKENIKIDFKPATANLKFPTNYPQVIAQHTYSIVCCSSETQDCFPFNFHSSFIRRIVLTTAKGQSLPVSLFSTAQVKVMYENPIPNLSVI